MPDCIVKKAIISQQNNFEQLNTKLRVIAALFSQKFMKKSKATAVRD
jgi:hypothetical protein